MEQAALTILDRYDLTRPVRLLGVAVDYTLPPRDDQPTLEALE
ncbi:hypothetical protein [Nonomuraea sp. NPDC049400]